MTVTCKTVTAECVPNWQCTNWSPCQNPGTGVWTEWRQCEDMNRCIENLNPGRIPPDYVWIETRPCTPPPQETFRIELVLTVVPYTGYEAQPNERLLAFDIYVGNPTSSPVNVDAILKLDGIVRGEPYMALGNIPTGSPFRQIAAGSYRFIYPGETHTVCITPRTSTVWSEQCKTKVIT